MKFIEERRSSDAMESDGRDEGLESLEMSVDKILCFIFYFLFFFGFCADDEIITYDNLIPSTLV